MELIKTKTDIRQKLWDNTSYLRKELIKKGFNIGKSVSPIFAIMVRDNKKFIKLQKCYKKEHLDFLVNALEEINKIIPIKQ